MKRKEFTYSLSNCVECFSPKLLLEDILYQFGYCDSCSRLTDFVKHLQKLFKDEKKTIFILLDNAQLLRSEQVSDFSLILPTLLSISTLVCF